MTVAFLAGALLFTSLSGASADLYSHQGGAWDPDATCTTGSVGCATVTVNGFDVAHPDADPNIGDGLGKGAALSLYSFIVNVDNTRLASDPQHPERQNGIAPTESHSPIIALGDQDRNTVGLPDGRYLISMRSPDHQMWGQHITIADGACSAGCASGNNVDIVMTEQSADKPLPLGSIRVFVFDDNTWTNGAPDTGPAGAPETEQGLSNFQVELYEQTNSRVTVDYHNKPLCSDPLPDDPAPGHWPGCKTDSDGFAMIDKLGPATYFTEVVPPPSCDPNHPSGTIPGDGQWVQTTTIDGGLSLQTGVEEGSDGAGAPGEQLWEAPDKRTGFWFGFVCTGLDFPNQNGTGEITGQARNWQGWPPFDVLTYGEPVADAYVALSDSNSNQTLWVGQADGQGNFDIPNVPAGDYNLSIWDEQLSYIMRFVPVHVDNGQSVNVNETDDNGESGVGVPRWFGWLDGYVYKDSGVTESGVDLGPGKAGNGIRDCNPADATDCEPGVPHTDVDQRWRDGSIKESTFTDTNGYYEYPTAEGGALGKWIIGEQGFTRFGVTGASVHDEHHPNDVTHVPDNQGGDLLTNQLLTEGHRATVDWGKVDYDPGTTGQIVGITYWATTRNEFHGKFQAHEDYEPAIPDSTVLLEGLGPDGLPNTDDDIVLNKYVTDHWQHPDDAQTPSQACAVTDLNGNAISGLNPDIGPRCLEVPITGEQTKDGAFDGGYAFADYCPPSTGGYDMTADDGSCADHSDPVALDPGKYIVHSLSLTDSNDDRPCNPDGLSQQVTDAHGAVPGGGIANGDPSNGGVGCIYRPVREEDVNVDLGNQYSPAIPPPDCVGDMHTIDQSTVTTRSPFYGQAGAEAPLCDKKLVDLQPEQNFNADFFFMTNFRTDPNSAVTNADGYTPSYSGDVEEPGRLIGLVSNDIYFETNTQSPWYGEPRPIAHIPVGIYTRYDDNVNHWRLFTTVHTSTEGTYEALLPSTQTLNCPIPQGPCPGMYLVKVDDPGTPQHPNSDYDPNLLTATSAWDVWPGQTDQLDTPLDPISGDGCETPTGWPELLQVSNPVGTAGSTITITADFISSSAGSILLTDQATGSTRTLTTGNNGGIVSWTPGSGKTPDTIVIRIPSYSSSFTAGQKNLTIRNSGRQTSVNGITLHLTSTSASSGGGVQYNPTVVQVAPWSPPGPNGHPHALQDAIDSAPAGSLLVLSPGTYNENIVMWKPLKLQGLGPGGIIGAHELQSTAPEDPRFQVLGTVLDGRYFQANKVAWLAAASKITQLPTGIASVPGGAVVTVGSDNAGGYPSSSILTDARIDGLAIMTGQGNDTNGGAGGVQLVAKANATQITNNVLENNGGLYAGGIAVGAPGGTAAHNWDVNVQYNRLIGNGALFKAGGIGLFTDAQRYQVANSIVCANFSQEYGAGISHFGNSPGGRIHDNQIYYNESFDAGAGISIQPTGGTNGTGAVDVDRNLIQSNYSNDDGGGIYVLGSLDRAINIRNNQIVDNGAADAGGGILLQDAKAVTIVNNTVANNVSTGTSEQSAVGVPHGAGLVSEGDAVTPADQGTVHTNVKLNDGTLVLDPAAVAGDLNRTVTGSGIPNGTRITSVNVGAGFVVNNPSTITATGVSLTVNRVDRNTNATLVSTVAGSPVVHDWFVTADDVGRRVAGTGGGVTGPNRIGNGTTGRVITSVNTTARTFTMNGNAVSTGTAQVRIFRTDANGITNDGTLVADSAATAADVGKTVSGTGVQDGTTVLSVTPGQSLVMSLPATQTDSNVSITLTTPDFSNPVLFNNIFWNNTAYTVDRFTPGATLINQGTIDYEVRAASNGDTFTPRFSDNTTNQILRSDGQMYDLPSGQANRSGDPNFVAPFALVLGVGGSRLDPQRVSVTITGQDPIVGLTGDYHISLPGGVLARLAAAATSQVIDRGARCSNTSAQAPTNNNCTGTGVVGAPTVDFDNQTRPVLMTTRGNTRWDMGADESTVLP
jgi:large repetitive protein